LEFIFSLSVRNPSVILSLLSEQLMEILNLSSFYDFGASFLDQRDFDPPIGLSAAGVAIGLPGPIG
jgi:hypothetical protein